MPGQDPVQRPQEANDELVLEGPEPLKFIIGAPMAVNIEYQGKSIDMSRYNNAGLLASHCRRSNLSAMSAHESPIIRRKSRQIMVGNVPVGGDAPSRCRP